MLFQDVRAPFDRSERVLVPGSARYGEYLLLGLLALVGTVGFFIVWPGFFNRRYPIPYFLVTLALIYYLTVWAARWIALRTMRRPQHLDLAPDLRVAVVTSFVPDLEPTEMLEQTVRHLVAIEYPHDTWVLDEGNDPSVRELCARLGAIHFTRKHLPEYQGDEGVFAANTKHGNYNAWLNERGYDRYDMVVTFDPDHVPEPDYLTRLLGHFRDPSIGYVQAPQVYYNQEASFIARGAAEETYAYHSSHLMASCGLGHTVVIGSHSAHRVTALRAVGGFPAHDAEDLYLTMVYRAHGWHGVYVPEILAMGTAPVDWAGYLGQQRRWARSVLDLKRTVLPALFGNLTVTERVLNFFHGSYYFRPLLLFPVYLSLLVLLILNAVPSFLQPAPAGALVGLGLLLAAIDRFRQHFFLDPTREGGIHWRALLLQIAKAPHLAAACFDFALSRRVGYTITPKVRKGRPARALTIFHSGVVAAILGAATVGYLRHDRLEPTLAVLAAAFMAISLLLIWTQWWRFPAPYDPALFAARRRAMAASGDASPLVRSARSRRRQLETAASARSGAPPEATDADAPTAG